MKIIIGEFTEYNRFRKDALKKDYFKQYVKEFSSLTYFLGWSKRIKRPVAGKYLAFIHDRETYVRNPAKLIKTLEEIEKNKPYLDVIWMTQRGGQIKDLTLTCEVINLNRYFHEDFKQTIMKDISCLTDEGLKEIIKIIGYSWQTYNLYRNDLIVARPISAADVRAKLKVKRLVSAAEVLEKVLFRKRFALQAYTRLCERYSEKWVGEFMQKELQNILEAKIKRANRDINLAKIRSNKNLAKYIEIILKAPIVDVFLLKTSCLNYLGIQNYLTYTSKQIINTCDSNLKEGVYKEHGWFK